MNSFLLLSTDLKTWLDFISSISSSLAWPLAIIIVCCIFKKYIVNLLPSLKNIKYGDFSLEFNHSVEYLQKELDKVVPEPEKLDKVAPKPEKSDKVVPKQEKPKDVFLKNENLKINGSLEPDLIVIYAWREVETKLKEKYLTLFPDNAKHTNSTHKILLELINNNIIQENILNLFLETMELRNKVIHTKNNDLTLVNAIRYNNVCNELLFIINNLGENSN